MRYSEDDLNHPAHQTSKCRVLCSGDVTLQYCSRKVTQFVMHYIIRYRRSLNKYKISVVKRVSKSAIEPTLESRLTFEMGSEHTQDN